MFPSLNEIIDAICEKDNNLIGDGSYKECIDFNDQFVLLIPLNFDPSDYMEGFHWLDFIIESGLVVGQRYEINEYGVPYVYAVEKVIIATDKRFEKHRLVISKPENRLEIIQKYYPEWDNAIKIFKEVFDLFDDFDLENFGFRPNGDPVLFDIIIAEY